MGNYRINKSLKTKSLDVLRTVFKIEFIEKFLVKKTTGKASDSFYSKLVPANYLYPTNSIRQIERNGIKYKLDISDLVDHYIYFGFKETGKEKLYSFVKPGMVIIDVGANIGETALNFSKLTGNSGLVFAFEPDKFNYEKATKNVSLNLVKNIRLINLGLGDENKVQKLYIVNDENRGMNRILTEDALYGFTEIKVCTLDSFLEEQSINTVHFIKIDVEGFEMNVLKGAIHLLQKFKPALFIELDDNNLKEHKSSALALVEFLNSLSYDIYKAETDELINRNTNFADCHFDIYAKQKNASQN